jgi:hypothetical protein
MLLIMLVTIYATRSAILDPSNTSWVLSEFHEIFVKRPNGKPIMIPTRTHAKVIAGNDVKIESIITATSIIAAVINGIISLKSSFLWSGFLRCTVDTNDNI